MKLFLNRRAGVFLLLVAAFLVSNWRYQEKEVYREASAKVTFVDQEDLRIDNVFKELDEPTYWMAGFPLRYWEKSEYSGMASSRIYAGALALNLLLWAIALGSFLAYEFYMANSLKKRLEANPKESKQRRMGLSDLMMLTGIIAVAVGYWRWSIYASSAESTFAGQIREAKGVVSSALLLPDIASQRMPETWHADLKRLREVALTNPAPEMIEKTVKLPYLNNLAIDGGTGDLSALAQLKSRPHFISLRLTARKLSEQDIKTIATLTQLQSLAICRSTLNDQWLDQLAALPRLQLLSVEDTEVSLKHIANLPCSKTLRILYTSRPEAGQADELNVSNWPELQKLCCNSLVRKPNGEPVTLTITDMPKLNHLVLDNLQLFELTLDKLPQLTRIEGQKDYWTNRVANGVATSIDPCYTRLKLGDLPKLNQVSLHAPALRELEFSAPLVCNFYFNSSIVRGNGSYVEFNRTPVARSRVQRWIDAFATSLGPSQVEFRNLDLRNTNFAPFSQSERVEILRFIDSEVDPAQVGALRGMKNLALLGVGQTPISGPQLEALIRSLPKLVQFECDSNHVTRLKLENLPEIRSLFLNRTGPTLPMEALHLVNVTNLIEKLELPPNLFYLHVDGAPSLTHLTTSGPWPNKAVFKGVRDLKVFSASGPNLKDELIDELLKCEKLEHLTLTDHDLSPTALARLSALTRLQSLTLSRTKLDDAAMEAFASLNQLTTLIVDETAITERSIPALAKLTSINQLSLAGNSIAPTSLAQLSALTQLRRLNCSGMQMSEEATHALAGIKSLQVLDLSNTELSAAALAPLGQLSSLEHLRLVDCKVDGRALMSVADQAGAVKFELTNSSVDRDTFDLLRHSQRVWSGEFRVPEPTIPSNMLSNPALR